ncbi:biopolymer transporter ExbD [Rickettsiales bacterium]|nr:biopolymer transporter ExbD [Rickettsiales bacterium]
MEKNFLFDFGKKKKKKVNIIPLIDIIFLMLVFFMLATNFSEDKRIDLSIQKNLEYNQKQSKTLKILIKPLGDYEIKDQLLSKKEIEKKILDLKVEKKFDDIHILNEKNTIVQDLIFLIDLLKKNKINKVFFSDLDD